ncbi:MAG: threonine synthase [Bacteroidetes bacterium 4484_276]|nr:MAG: threonine synthase [Bacteroidetes bacterium 4484_276]
MPTPIMFYTTNHRAPSLPFHEALLKGQAPDMGLYMPEDIPQVSAGEMAAMQKMEYHEIANLVIGKFLKGVIPQDELAHLCRDAYDYDVPLEHVYDRKYVMRLDRGPTASFKDFAGRMMGRLMNYYLTKMDRELLILTATSGDTGSAVANAFYGFENIKVLVLFPINEVTPRQRKQMTTLGKNVQIVGLDAKFDDCQALVKQAFADPELEYLKLSSANSINIGRLVPQSVYYFYAFAKLKKSEQEKVIFSVPSGNFGDMMGGMLALRMGLPIDKFVIATNDNDEFPEFLKTGGYNKIVPSKNCISSAMNVGHPSNLARLVAMYGGNMDEQGNISKQPDMELMNKEIYSTSISDAETKATIEKAWKNHKLLLEPHGAVGWSGLESFLKTNPEFSESDQLCVSLETAHPAKFPEQIREILNFDPELPPSLEGLEEKTEQFDEMENGYGAFKDYLKRKY